MRRKLRLVTALQAHGLTVAMTGDGVNDAPALKRADAGIAMGQKGSEAAKEASELVLADDNFASIAAAVREGRTVYDNIKKVISWTLPTNAGEASTIILALMLGMALPITPIQILWVNMVTAITLGIALAFEPTEDGTMRRPPRPTLLWHIILVATLFLAGVFGIYAYAIDRGYSIELARTLAMNTLVVMEIFHLFFIRNMYGTSLTWKAVRGTRRPVRDHLPAGHAVHLRHRASTLPGRAAHGRHRHRAVHGHRDREADPSQARTSGGVLRAGRGHAGTPWPRSHRPALADRRPAVAHNRPSEPCPRRYVRHWRLCRGPTPVVLNSEYLPP